MFKVQISKLPALQVKSNIVKLHVYDYVHSSLIRLFFDRQTGTMNMAGNRVWRFSITSDDQGRKYLALERSATLGVVKCKYSMKEYEVMGVVCYCEGEVHLNTPYGHYSLMEIDLEDIPNLHTTVSEAAWVLTEYLVEDIIDHKLKTGALQQAITSVWNSLLKLFKS